MLKITKTAEKASKAPNRKGKDGRAALPAGVSISAR